MLTPRQSLESTMAQELSVGGGKRSRRIELKFYLFQTLEKKYISNGHSECYNSTSYDTYEAYVK